LGVFLVLFRTFLVFCRFSTSLEEQLKIFYLLLNGEHLHTGVTEIYQHIAFV